MAFKENLLKKIEIDRLARKVLNSIGPPDSGCKVDKEAMRQLLEFGEYAHERVRDLDLYVKDPDQLRKKILVLDNELTIYHTTIEDAVMRKSPTIKEMISIRNAIKILNDRDVVVCKKDVAVKTVQKESIERLDLSFEAVDIEAIERDGIASLENGYADGVVECLDLFSELLGYVLAPKTLQIVGHKVIAKPTTTQKGEEGYASIVLYSMIHNVIRLVEGTVGRYEKDKIQWLQQVAAGKEAATAEGPFVFQYLRDAVIRKPVRSI